jgi:hypothetical protein
MNLLRPVLALLLACAIGSCLAEDASPRQAAPPMAAAAPSHMAAATDLVRSLHMEQYLQTMIEGLAPPGLKRDILQYIVMQRIDVRAFEAFGAKIYADTFTEEELRQLTVFFQSELGRKLQSRQVALQRNVSEAFSNSPEMMSNFFVSGCAAGAVAAAAEQARQFQINLGQQPPTVEAILKNIQPLVAKAETSCGCMFGKAMAAAQSKDLSKMFQEPAVKQAVDEAFKSGACPRPF